MKIQKNVQDNFYYTLWHFSFFALFFAYFLIFFFLTLLMIKKMKYIACEMTVIAALLKFLFFV